MKHYYPKHKTPINGRWYVEKDILPLTKRTQEVKNKQYYGKMESRI